MGRVRYGLERLANIQKSGSYLFFLNTATHPLPFHPRAVPLRREKLKSSTKNGEQKGSVYNNFSLVTVFGQPKDDAENNDRKHVISLETALKRCRVTEKRFLEKAIRFHKYFMLEGNPNNITTWGCDDVPKSALLQKMPKWAIEEDYRLQAIFKAAAFQKQFTVVRDLGIVYFPPLKNLPVASTAEIEKSLDKIFLAMTMGTFDEKGVIVPSLGRAMAMYSWIICMLVLLTFATVKRWAEFKIWSKDYFEMLLFVIISVPALLEYITSEPSIIRNALHANRTLWKNSQVKKYFSLTEFDYAVMALLNTPMWLVSKNTGSYLLQEGHPGLKGDCCVTDISSLRRVGFYVGRSMARREWENHNVSITNNGDGSIGIKNTISSIPWITGEGENKLVA